MTAAVQATLSTGIVSGESAGTTRRFLGIPYAAAPFGANRFRPPQPVTPWAEVRDATSFGPTPPQLPYPPSTAELLGSVAIPGDKILTVNVWTPVGASAAPVVLWIHGGALERGTAALSIYDGASFADDGIVFVSLNYRLGSEGFSVLDGAPSNLGLQDAAAALAWVRREISAFGGDPDQITVMGESAGGALVAALLADEASRAHIARAIIESGPLDARPRKKAGRVTAQIARRLGIAADAAGFLTVRPDDLLEARRRQSAGSSPLRGAPGFQLTLDPATLPVSPHEVLPHVDVPLVIGSNTDEYRLWFSPAALSGISRLTLLIARLALRVPRRAISAYRRAFPEASTGEIFGQLATDAILRRPLTEIAKTRSAATYIYEFAWPSPVRDLRAAHALELGFVFDALRDPEAVRMAGDTAPQALADEMHAAWVAFIKTGDPGWPAFDEQRSTRLFDVVSSTVPQRRSAAMDLLP